MTEQITCYVINPTCSGQLAIQLLGEDFSGVLIHDGGSVYDRFANYLKNDLDDLFTFLSKPTVDATNWRGEQAIRSAIVNCKVLVGNRTWNGSQVKLTLTTLLVTSNQQAINPLARRPAWTRSNHCVRGSTRHTLV